MPLTEEEQAELERLRAAFEELGGRGVEMAERIDELEEKAKTPFQRVVDEYEDSIHGAPFNSIESLDLNPEANFILIEENTHGGYWLSTWDDKDEAYTHQREQEYGGDWEFTGLVDLKSGKNWYPKTVRYVIDWEEMQ